MSETIGLPQPPPVGETALQPGTYDGVCVFVTGGGTGLGKAIASEFARLGASLVIASRKDEHLDAARAAMEELGADGIAVTCDIREPDSIAAAFDAAEEAFGLPGVLDQQRRGQLPRAGRGHVAERVAHGGRHHAQRHVLLLPRVRPPTPRRRHARVDREHRRVLRVDRRSGVRALGRGEGRGEEPDRVPGGRVGSLRDPGERARAGALPPRGHDRRHPGQPVAHARQGRAQPALRVGQRQELGWAATFLASPYARFISGHTLVVDGANWQRRSLTNPPVVTVREQMGRDPFEG